MSEWMDTSGRLGCFSKKVTCIISEPVSWALSSLRSSLFKLILHLKVSYGYSISRSATSVICIFVAYEHGWSCVEWPVLHTCDFFLIFTTNFVILWSCYLSISIVVVYHKKCAMCVTFWLIQKRYCQYKKWSFAGVNAQILKYPNFTPRTSSFLVLLECPWRTCTVGTSWRTRARCMCTGTDFSTSYRQVNCQFQIRSLCA